VKESCKLDYIRHYIQNNTCKYWRNWMAR